MPDRLLLPIAVFAIFGLALLALRDTYDELRNLRGQVAGPLRRWRSISHVRGPRLALRSLLGLTTIFAMIAMLARFAGPIAFLALLPWSPFLARAAWHPRVSRFRYDWKTFAAKALVTLFFAWLFAPLLTYAGATVVVAVDFTFVAAAEAVVLGE
ncbi:MAG: hypothetical protein AAGF97_19240 [Planctomycetota bacterium]